MKKNALHRPIGKDWLRTWIDIDRTAIEDNFHLFRKLLSPKTKLMAVVKSNAYGHGFLDFSNEMERLGTDWFGVDELDEGLQLRKAGIIKPILVLGFTPLEAISVAAEFDISITVSNYATLSALKKYKNKVSLKIHIKADTGLHRQGFQTAEQEEIAKTVCAFPKDRVILEGLYTHFATAENPSSSYSLGQLKEFNRWLSTFIKVGLSPLCHTAGTAATILLPQSHFDMVRVGIGLYGLWPSNEVREYAEDKITLRPILSWKGVVGDVKSVKNGERVGYDLTEKLSRDSRIAVCGVGYWHGFPRSLSGKGVVGVRGKPVRVLGRVSMGMIALDVTDVPTVATGDEVVFIGKSANREFSADVLAESAGTINYEIVTRINPFIPRLYRE